MGELDGLIAGLRRFRRGENGQVLILFALAGTVLVGFSALALDVGNLYVARRSAQNAADASALVGAQNWTGVIPNVTLVVPDAVRDARQYAIINGYATDPGANNGMWNGEVRVDVPPSTGPNAGKPDHIEVNIKTPVNSLFAGIFGVDNVQISARAVARSKHMGFDAATISLDPGDASTFLNGSVEIEVLGNTYSRGVTKSLSGELDISGIAFAKGGFTGSGIDATKLITNVPDLFDPRWPAPTAISTPGISWNSNGIVERQTRDGDGYLWISPGTYDWISIASSDRVKFLPGVYRVTRSQGVTINGVAVGTGPVCFVLDSPAKFEVQGGADVSFSSSKDLYNNILIWSATGGSNAVKISGGGSVSLGGTVYAPNGTVRVAGSVGGTIHGQVVAQNIYFEGTAGTAVAYDSGQVPETPGPTLVE